tara:strand:- start:2509 stop:2871 length:363 start_codon:yes stop_codon:yes gene_type:complete
MINIKKILEEIKIKIKEDDVIMTFSNNGKFSTNMNELINDYRVNIEAETDADMKKMYEDDRGYFTIIRNFIEYDCAPQAKIVLQSLDTHPREQMVVAVAKDYGTKWVADNFGYEIKSWAI